MTKPAEFQESPYLAKVRLKIGARPDIMCHRQHAGTYCPPRKPDVFIKVAPDGIPDIIGVQMRRVKGDNIRLVETINPNSFNPHEREIDWFYGQMFAIETKSSEGRQRLEQMRWESSFVAMGGVYILAPAPRFDLIFAELGEEPDPECARVAQERFAILKAKVDEYEARSVRRAASHKDRKRR
jgi:hypothetical protein